MYGTVSLIEVRPGLTVSIDVTAGHGPTLLTMPLPGFDIPDATEVCPADV